MELQVSASNKPNHHIQNHPNILRLGLNNSEDTAYFET